MSRRPLARDVMRTDPPVVQPDATVWAALATMRERGVQRLLIVEDGALVGILSNRDYRKILHRAGPDGTISGLADIRVREIMTSSSALVTATPGTPVVEIASLLLEHGVGCVPIVDDAGRPVGMISPADVIRSLLDTP